MQWAVGVMWDLVLALGCRRRAQGPPPGLGGDQGQEEEQEQHGGVEEGGSGGGVGVVGELWGATERLMRSQVYIGKHTVQVI